MPLRPEDWPRVRDVFERALALPADERMTYVSAACGSNGTMRDELVRMLESHGRAAHFMSRPAAAQMDRSGAAPSLEGRQIGPYLVSSRIGAGGMGEVYKARDTRLDRTVAIKVLPPHAIDDPAARERFVREGRAIAALNHPNICALYDVGDSHGDAGAPLFLVMEFLDGEPLANRLVRGAIPTASALQMAGQVATALDKAHRAGIVHRDLKPGNVFLVGSAAAPTVKLLDFGLAKAATPALDLATRGAVAANLTVPGTILGTVQYMAPEQVEGKETDARTDIFAFGALLHEMLTGTKAFTGASQASLTVAILEHEPPPVSALVPSVPAALDRVIRKCLAKDPDERWQSAADLASELQWIAQGGATPAAPRAVTWTRARIASTVAGVAGVALLAVVVAVGRPSSSPVPLTPKQFVVTLPDLFDVSTTRVLVLMPDGSGIAYRTGGAGRGDSRLNLYTLRDGVSRALPGTDGANYAFVSPDGKWLGFFQKGRLRRVALGGGSPIDVCEAPYVSGASWGADDRIVFTGPDGLWKVLASGGQPERVTTLATGEAAHVHPDIVPGADAVVFTVLSKSGAMNDAAVAVASMRTGERHVLVKSASSARYARSGHLLYVRGSDFVAVAFDRDTLTTSGSPVVVVAGIQTNPQELLGHFDVSNDGTLAYLPSTGAELLLRTLVWVDRNAVLQPLPAPPQPYAHPVLLPDGTGLILELEATPHSLWRYDFGSGAMTLLTRDGANHRAVVSPDGRSIVYSSDRTAPRSLYRQATDGSGGAEHLLDAPHAHNATSWSPDGHWLAFTESHPRTKGDIWLLALDGDRRARPFLATPFAEREAVFSPDGHWIAYTSDESGRDEVIITAFPGPGPRQQVSTGGGELPLFSGDGRTLYYKLRERTLSVNIATRPALTVGARRVAFEIPGAQRLASLPFPVSPAGDRLLYVKEPDANLSALGVHIVVNWFQELRQLTAAK